MTSIGWIFFGFLIFCCFATEYAVRQAKKWNKTKQKFKDEFGEKL